MTDVSSVSDFEDQVPVAPILIKTKQGHKKLIIFFIVVSFTALMVTSIALVQQIKDEGIVDSYVFTGKVLVGSAFLLRVIFLIVLEIYRTRYIRKVLVYKATAFNVYIILRYLCTLLFMVPIMLVSYFYFGF